MAYVKLVGTTNPTTNWTTEVVLEKDEDGNPTKVVRQGVPVELSKQEQDKLEKDLGLVFEKSSKEEADEAAAAAAAASDTAGTAPVFGDAADQTNEQNK